MLWWRQINAQHVGHVAQRALGMRAVHAVALEPTGLRWLSVGAMWWPAARAWFAGSAGDFRTLLGAKKGQNRQKSYCHRWPRRLTWQFYVQELIAAVTIDMADEVHEMVLTGRVNSAVA
jgi:hypothetical protein